MSETLTPIDTIDFDPTEPETSDTQKPVPAPVVAGKRFESSRDYLRRR